MIIKRIPAPTFTIEGEQYNEYELRQLMLDVAKGETRGLIPVTDSIGITAVIGLDGRLSNELEGLDLSDKLASQLWQTNQ